MGLFGGKKVKTPREKKPSRRSSGSKEGPEVGCPCSHKIKGMVTPVLQGHSHDCLYVLELSVPPSLPYGGS